MDPLTWVLSIEVTRRDAHSALPHAEVRPHRTRWRRLRAAARRVVGPDDPPHR